MNVQHRQSRSGRGILAPLALALGLALIPLAGAPSAHADQRHWTWSSQNWSHNWSHHKWSSQGWSSQNWSSHNRPSQNWSSRNWSPHNRSSQNWSSRNWSPQNWSQNTWPRNWPRSQWKNHADWRDQQRWQHHRPRFNDGFRPCFGCGSRLVFNGGHGFNGVVLFSSPGFAVVRPSFVVRQPGFIVRQPGFVDQPVFSGRQPLAQPRVIPLAPAMGPMPAVRIIRPGMNNSGIRFIRPGD